MRARVRSGRPGALVLIRRNRRWTVRSRSTAPIQTLVQSGPFGPKVAEEGSGDAGARAGPRLQLRAAQAGSRRLARRGAQ